MSTRSAAAAASSSKRKRPSASATPADSPAKRRTTRGGGGASAAATDPPTLVPVAPPKEGWCGSLRRAREAGEFIDITLIVSGRRIAAHKLVIVSHSPYLHGLLTSGLAESRDGGDELTVGDASTDGRAVEAIVDCFYSGKISVSRSSVSSVIRTANLFGVDAVEKAACDYFVEALEPSSACEALAFAAAHFACGEHARGLHERCVGYVVEHFAECSVEPSFLVLPCEAVAEVIGSDDLPVEEAVVLAAVRAWFDHDTASRQGSLELLLPLVRWPLLPVETRLKLEGEPLLLRLMLLGEQQSCALAVKLLLELTAEFSASDAAAACPRLKRRKGAAVPVLPLAFTAIDQEYYTTSEDGALLAITACPNYRVALCHERVMNSGRSCAEITVVRTVDMMIGVARPTLDPNTEEAYYNTGDFWGVYSEMNGEVLHNGDAGHAWEGMQGYGTGDVLRLLLDSDAGTLTVKKNGTLLGVAVTSGLTGDLCWAVASCGTGDSVRIKAVDPAEF